MVCVISCTTLLKLEFVPELIFKIFVKKYICLALNHSQLIEMKQKNASVLTVYFTGLVAFLIIMFLPRSDLHILLKIFLRNIFIANLHIYLHKVY